MFFKKILKLKLFFVIIAIILIISAMNILGGYLLLPGPSDKEKIVIIKQNLSVAEISKVLQKEGVIKYRLLFEIVGKAYSYYKPLKSGEYKFTTKISPYQILKQLNNGKSVIHRMFILEGSTVSEILELINSEERLFGKIVDNIPEGYLMPSTYFYSYGDQREKIIDTMRNKMSLNLDNIMYELSENSPIKTRNDLLILASIIEKEAGNDSERAQIAGVFVNRLKKGMKLQADPTVIYAITKGEYKLKRSLTKTDLKIESPYNTYHVNGLPVGAISCPGLKSLKAAASPAQTNDLYFVSDGKGGHNFSSSLQQHNIYVNEFRTKATEQ